MQINEMMKEAIKLALKGTGKVAPNPRVGCVIVQDGKIVSSGYHKQFGANHAERDAILNAKNIDLDGAELFVNLEPCNHDGKTPPCTDLIISSGIKKVYIGIRDPNPLVSGSGVERLKAAGIEVVEDVCKEDCCYINRYFFKYIVEKKPYVILKVAQTIDGKIAMNNGKSQWITNEDSRQYVHILRAEVDLVITGKNTVMKDDPRLTVRNANGRNPKRLVLDSKLSLPLSKAIFTDSFRENTFIACGNDFTNTKKANSLITAGVKIIGVDLDDNGRVDLCELLERLSLGMEISSILVEAGAEVNSSFVKNDLVDELNIFTAPITLGTGINSFNFLQGYNLNNAPKYDLKTVTRLGNDILSVYTRLK